MKKVSKKEVLISVIVPIYNVEAYLERCVNSILNQTYKNLEIILVDDGSPDNCPKMCDDYAKKDERVVVIHKENGGLSDARNAGINIAKGKYLTFVDSDDYVEKNYVEFLYNLIDKYDADISMGKQYVKYPDKLLNTGTGVLYSNLTKEEILKKLLYSDDFDVSASVKLYKRELFKNIRFPKGRIFEDTATMHLFIDNSKRVVLYSVPIYYYAMRNNSITNCTFNERKLDLIKSTEEMTNYIQNKYPNLESGCKRRMMYAYLSTLTQLAKSKNKDEKSKRFLMKYIKENRKIVLKDKNIPKRDRVGLYCSFLGFNFFKISWNIYEKIRK